MANISAWLGSANSLPAGTERNRAVLAWRRIQHKPRSVQFSTAAGVLLPAQTVRVEYDSGASEDEGGAGRAPVKMATIFGVKGHPDASVPDSDIKPGYTFADGDNLLRIVSVFDTLGERQADAEIVG